MTSNELRELVKSHFNLVEADAEVNVTEIEETFSEETTEEVVEESFGEIADENKAFVLSFPGDELEVGDKVSVTTTEGQGPMDAPDGEHRLTGGVVIVTKDSVVESIEKSVAETSEEALEEEGDKIVEEEMSEEFDARTDAEEEGYKDGMEDAIEDIKEAIADVVAEDMETAEPVSAEEIIKEISDAISSEMGKLKQKMEALEEKVAKFEMEPAAEKTIVSPGKMASKFSAAEAKNSKDMELMLRMIKNKK
jgi:hypothetical protein